MEKVVYKDGCYLFEGFRGGVIVYVIRKWLYVFEVCLCVRVIVGIWGLLCVLERLNKYFC